MEKDHGKQAGLYNEGGKMTMEDQFQRWWSAYPNRKGKGDAMKAFKTASKLASLEEMLDGITRYVANKPDWQAYKYPGSWLRGQHWADEWEPQQSRVSRPGESTTQHRQREILMMQYRNARDEGNATEAARLRALIG